ncbi:MAG: N-acetylmuramoyl-L-alanine amidase [Thiomicrorhabdus chilensis]|uniref:N-acetylmuramoyl-L-alanine amidase n=1 Tax=Thiomicrorhabdus chilensis TaxID=63656 RepID=UPI00299EEC5D|nr:N-acetylmuramoyl-L-alanine amidase [Thiomicrorhabdus chilensis]MDX1347034.1 N-acetylmuramoyl-L-alanine amidase [Thiomicrorhabdus chilensis]
MKSLIFTRKTMLLWLAMILLGSTSVAYAQAELANLRVGQKTDKTRIVFDIKQNHSFKVYKLNNPSRIVVDFKKTDNRLNFSNKHFNDSLLYRVRVSENSRLLRIVLDLHKNLDYHYFTLGKNRSGAERLVIDLLSPHASSTKVVKAAPEKSQTQSSKSLLTKATSSQKALVSVQKSKPLVEKPSQVSLKVAREVKRNQATQSLLDQGSSVLVKQDMLVVAIDPGHGGKDVGAVGHNHVYEKNATLQMSRELKRLIDQQPGMRAVLTRDRDVFIPLHERVKIAKKHDADIFISVHADAFHDRSVRGGSVYVLSNGGASSVMARLLAKSENASLQDISLKGYDRDVAFALSDLTREANIRASRKLGKHVLKEMQKSVKMHKHSLQSAEFAVLKSIDMPSLLVETAFISNPSEARKLMNKTFQLKMAASIVRGLQQFVEGNGQKPRWGESLYVHYKVQPGDTLSEIASNYNVSTSTLKKINDIKNANQLYVGKKIKIPLSEQMVAGL